jgi:aminomethyltransferase
MILTMQTTPLTQTHIALGAKMADFAGFHMPIQYSSITEEHHAVRQRAGLFDVSHMGEFIVKGREALDLIQYVTSNDASKLSPGDVQYSCLPNENGGIVDDLLVYRLAQDMCSEGEQAFMLVVNASNIAKDWDWINRHNTFDARLSDISERTGLLALQGPKAIEILEKLTNLSLKEIQYYSFVKGTVAGIDNVLVSATGYTGAGGFELYVESQNTVALWNALMEAGAFADVKPCGLGARDTLRLEMGFCLYGNDIDDTTSPLEAGLGWITKLQKNQPCIASNLLKAQKEQGLKRKLAAFTMDERRVPRQHYPITDEHGDQIGVVTSGTQSPSLDKPIGLGYLPANLTKAGTRIWIQMGSKLLPALVCQLPFYKNKPE